ncbi:MAG: PIN domain nuclease [Chloroflexota bacterium]
MRAELYLVDTSIWLEVLPPGRGTPELRERMDLLLAGDVVATTGMVRLELLGGMRTQGEYRRLAELLRALHTLAVTEHMWDTACRAGFELRRRGITVPFTDLLIAAVAMGADAVLVHGDSHFDSIAQHAPLKVESYVR